MEDAARAERLLREVLRPKMQQEFAHRTLATLLDTIYVSMLQMAHKVFAIRDEIGHSSEALVRSQERANKVRERSQKVAEDLGRKLREARAREAGLEDRIWSVEAEMDAWWTRYKEAKSQVLVERGRASAAEAETTYAATQWQAAERRAEELAEILKLEECRADALQCEQAAVLERDEKAESAAAEAERRRIMVVALAGEAGAWAEEADRVIERAETWAREVEAAAAEWVRRTEFRVQEAESRARNTIAELRGSEEFVQEVTEASLDAYAQGFNECKAKVAEVFRFNPSDLEAICLSLCMQIL